MAKKLTRVTPGELLKEEFLEPMGISQADGYWLRAQAAYDTEVTREQIAPELKKIRSWKNVAAALV